MDDIKVKNFITPGEISVGDFITCRSSMPTVCLPIGEVMLVKAVQLPLIVIDAYLHHAEKSVLKGVSINTTTCSLMLINDDFVKAKMVDPETKEFLD